MIDLGPLDRTGQLYRNTPSAGRGGAVVFTRTPVGRLPLTKVKIPTRTRLTAEKDGEQTDAVFRTRWFDGLSTGMILVCEGQTFRITRRDELGRREGWEIYAQENT